MNLKKFQSDSDNLENLSNLTLPPRNKPAWPRKLFVATSLIVILSLLLRVYTVSLGLPYFYNEDEAHHFNRTVEMVQRGDYNPNYFHKPSFHFYLRMPVVAASFLWTVKQGHIKSIHDIKTKDQHGLSGYSLTSTHPGIVKWNRSLSLIFALGIVVLSVLIAYCLTASIFWSCVAGAITGLSPGLIEYGSVIGVDMPTAFFCTAAVYAGLLHQRTNTFITLLLSCLCAGLAVSTKYNALPVALVPFIASLTARDTTLPRMLIALLLPGATFFAASPYILVSLPIFLDHFAYEIWHYGQASHIGHSGNPGWEQVIFYGSWLVNKGIGSLSLAACILGLLALFKNPKLLLVVASFPLIYFALMVSQKTHFERNMLMLLGVLPAVSAVGLKTIGNFFAKFPFGKVLNAFLVLCLLTPIAFKAVSERETLLLSPRDSRDEAFEWINNNTPDQTDTALHGSLQLPSFRVFQGGISKLSVSGIKRLDLSDYTALELFQLGFSRIVAGPNFNISSQEEPFLSLKKEIPGSQELGRIPNNPTIRIFDFVGPTEINLNSILSALINSNVRIPDVEENCNELEEYCWTSNRLTKINQLPGSSITMISPWPNQKITFFEPESSWQKSFDIESTASSIDLSDFPDKNLYLFTPEVHVPSHYSDSQDNRRLGIGWKSNNFVN